MKKPKAVKAKKKSPLRATKKSFTEFLAEHRPAGPTVKRTVVDEAAERVLAVLGTAQEAATVFFGKNVEPSIVIAVYDRITDDLEDKLLEASLTEKNCCQDGASKPASCSEVKTEDDDDGDDGEGLEEDYEDDWEDGEGYCECVMDSCLYCDGLSVNTKDKTCSDADCKFDHYGDTDE